jgi:hypothetical protein
MARAPLPLGDHGSITLARSGAKWVAPCRVRDLDGKTRKLERWGATRTAANSAIQDALRGTTRCGGSETTTRDVEIP